MAGPRDGSAMSSKQLARTVHDGKMLTFHLTTGDDIKGYLCGMDDYHWMIVTTDGEIHLIHKGGAIVIDISAQATYHEKHKTAELEQVIAPFRDHVEGKFFGVEAVAS